MRRLISALGLGCAFVFFPLLMVGQSATSALRDFLSAKEPHEVERFLLDATLLKVRQLPLEQREHLLQVLLFGNRFREAGAVIEDSKNQHTNGGGQSSEQRTIRLVREWVDGTTAFVQLELCDAEGCTGGAFVSMRHQGGSWRIAQIMPVEVTFDLENDIVRLADRSGRAGYGNRVSANESSAVGSLRTLNTAIVTYAATFEKIGLPPGLSVLGGDDDNTDYTPESAKLVDPVLGCAAPPCEKSGYRFTYTIIDKAKGTYEITAVPVEYGRSGMRSFFTNQTGIMRVTAEDRPATADDPPLQ